MIEDHQPYHLSNIGVGVTYIDVTGETGLTTIRTDSNHSLVPGNAFVIQGTKNSLFDDRKLVVDGVEDDIPLRSITCNVGIITSGISTNHTLRLIQDCLVLVYLLTVSH